MTCTEERERAIALAYAAGWASAAKWAGRNDLMADIDSPAYQAERARKLGLPNAAEATDRACAPHAADQAPVATVAASVTNVPEGRVSPIDLSVHWPAMTAPAATLESLGLRAMGPDEACDQPIRISRLAKPDRMYEIGGDALAAMIRTQDPNHAGDLLARFAIDCTKHAMARHFSRSASGFQWRFQEQKLLRAIRAIESGNIDRARGYQRNAPGMECGRVISEGDAIMVAVGVTASALVHSASRPRVPCRGSGFPAATAAAPETNTDGELGADGARRHVPVPEEFASAGGWLAKTTMFSMEAARFAAISAGPALLQHEAEWQRAHLVDLLDGKAVA